MAKRPLVAIVGRPNVGKSLLFNRLCGKRLSIVEDTPGVTRDRLYAECEWAGRTFDIVDTGGIEPTADSEILLFMREQAEIAINSADVIVFVTEIGTGVTAADQEVAAMLKRSHKPVVLCVNKMDSVGQVDPGIYEFYSLGLGDPIALSAIHGHGTDEMLDACIENFPPEEEGEEEYKKLAESYKMELDDVKKALNADGLKSDLKLRKAARLIADSAVAVAPKAPEAAEEAPASEE